MSKPSLVGVTLGFACLVTAAALYAERTEPTIAEPIVTQAAELTAASTVTPHVPRGGLVWIEEVTIEGNVPYSAAVVQ